MNDVQAGYTQQDRFISSISKRLHEHGACPLYWACPLYYGKRTGPREAVSIDLLVFARVELIIPERLFKPICGRGRANTNEKRVEQVRRSIVERAGGTEGGG